MITARPAGVGGSGGGAITGRLPTPSGTVTMTVRPFSWLQRTQGMTVPGGFLVLVTWPKEQVALVLGGLSVGSTSFMWILSLSRAWRL